jgi:hypothetical protein
MEAEFFPHKSKVNVTYTQKFISCLTENKIFLHYKNKTLILFRKICAVYCRKHSQHKNTAKCGDLNVTVGLLVQRNPKVSEPKIFCMCDEQRF